MAAVFDANGFGGSDSYGTEGLPTLLASRVRLADARITKKTCTDNSSKICPVEPQDVPNAYHPSVCVRNTFIECVDMRLPSLDGFYQDREVLSCPASHIGRLTGIFQESSTGGNEGVGFEQHPCLAEASVKPLCPPPTLAACINADTTPTFGAGDDSFGDHVDFSARTSCIAGDVRHHGGFVGNLADRASTMGRRAPPASLTNASLPPALTPQMAAQDVVGIPSGTCAKRGAKAVVLIADALERHQFTSIPGCPPPTLRFPVAPISTVTFGQSPGFVGVVPVAPPPASVTAVATEPIAIAMPKQIMRPVAAPPIGMTMEMYSRAFPPKEFAMSSTGATYSSSDLPSVGSVGHAYGRCKPCIFFHTKGCENGALCQFCHVCEAGEKKRRKDEKQQHSRAVRKMR